MYYINNSCDYIYVVICVGVLKLDGSGLPEGEAYMGVR
jgi:hypothetical protein